MSHCKSLIFASSALSLLVSSAVDLGDVQAQPAELTIDTSTGTVPQPPEPAAASPAPQPAAPAAEGEPVNMFYGEYLEDVELEETKSKHAGIVPRTHTVVTGDTLWDLSAYYFHTPWDWPKVWKLNPEIADPHSIYPGNIVRLREGGPEPVAQKDGDEFDNTPQIAPARGQGYGLRQSAYIDLKDLDDSGTIDGSVAEKSLLSVGDSVYLKYEDDKYPAVGTTLAVYSSGKKIKRDGKAVGAYVEVAAQLRVTFAKKGKRARAVITRSIDPVERGMRTGPLELNFKDTKPVVADTKVDGEIVGLIGPDELIGARAAVLLDRGSKDGVQVGNRFLVIRRGDAYRRVLEPGQNVGQDDEDYPARAIGEILVLQTGEQACLGVVSFSIHEFGIGDRVFMRKGQ